MIPSTSTAAMRDQGNEVTPEDQYPRYVDDGLLQNGVPSDPEVVPGDNYTLEEIVVDGTKQKGIDFSMELRDENQRPTGREVLVHLDWFIPKKLGGDVPCKKFGTGHKTLNKPGKTPEYENVRYSECVYAVYLTQGNKRRFYVVFLPKETMEK